MWPWLSSGCFQLSFREICDPRLYQPWCGSFMISIQSKHNTNASDFGTNSWREKNTGQNRHKSRGRTSKNAGKIAGFNGGKVDRIFPQGSRPTSSGSHPMRWDCRSNVAWVRRSWSAARSPMWRFATKEMFPTRVFEDQRVVMLIGSRNIVYYLYVLPWKSTKS